MKVVGQNISFQNIINLFRYLKIYDRNNDDKRNRLIRDRSIFFRENYIQLFEIGNIRQ